MQGEVRGGGRVQVNYMKGGALEKSYFYFKKTQISSFWTFDFSSRRCLLKGPLAPCDIFPSVDAKVFAAASPLFIDCFESSWK